MESNPMGNPIQHSLCVVDKNIVNCVISLCKFRGLPEQKDPRNVINHYHLRCLSIFIEAITLYDRVVYFDSLPNPYSSDSLYEIPICTINENETGTISWDDSYEGLSFEESSDYWPLSNSAIRLKDGSRCALYFLLCPESVLNRNIEQIKLLGHDPVLRSLRSFSAEHFIETIHPDDLDWFFTRYAGHQIGQIEKARGLASLYSAAGTIVSPTAAPFWNAEHEAIELYLHQHFKEFQETLASAHAATDTVIDLSPLIAVLLDSTLSLEMLPETLWLLRRDYKELREISSIYQVNLEDAENYAELSEIIRDWGQAWDKVIKRIGIERGGFLSRLIGWDVIKKGSLKGIFLNALAETGKELSGLEVRRGLNMLHELEAEFLQSRRIRTRIKEIFGQDIA